MDLNFVENCQKLKHEVITNWKTGVVMVGVAIVVGQIYGKVAVGFVLLFSAYSYDMIAQPIRMITWLGFGNCLIAIGILGTCHFNIINPKATTVIAVIWALMAVSRLTGMNEELTSINQDMKPQNAGLESHNEKLAEIREGLKELEEALNNLVEPAAKLKTAQDENTATAEVLVQIIPDPIQEIPARLQKITTLLKALDKAEMQELIAFEADWRSKTNAMLIAFQTFNERLGPLTEKVDTLGSKLAATAAAHEENVRITSEQVATLKEVLDAARSYQQRRAV